ncbi:MAG: D-alanyl-D-alanine carboxypeptidase [Clostridia bacterium]|nr:D-alanyl-D-alanine carboxypeptidase [Clostridia bacterium]
MHLFRRILVIFMALLMLCAPLMARAEFVEPTLPPDTEAYDPEHPELLSEDQIYARAAIVIEESTGNVIFEKNADTIMYPASTTKIMTVLLGILAGNMSDTVTVSAHAVDLPDDATTISLDEGEQINMQDLLYGTLMRSANDGAMAIAEHISGSEAAFAELMNQTAAAYGMTNTHFVNPHGLHDPNHFTTARDMAILAREAMLNDTFRDIAGRVTYNMAATSFTRERTITTRHRIMRPTYNDDTNKYYYSYATGIKSGYTDQAGYCYVGSATKNGVNLISVVMYSGYYHYMDDTERLLEYGFSQYEHVTLSELYEKNPITVYTSGYSLDDTLLGELELACSPKITGKTAEITATRAEIEYLTSSLRDLVLVQYERDLVAPISAGEVIGTMTYLTASGEPIEYNLIATRTINERTDRPPTLEEIEAYTLADPNPFPPLTVELVLLLLSPFLAVAAIILVIRFLFSRYKKFYARLPKNRNRYVK